MLRISRLDNPSFGFRLSNRYCARKPEMVKKKINRRVACLADMN